MICPATFIIDHYIHAYDIACRKDPYVPFVSLIIYLLIDSRSTNQYCDTLIIQSLSNADWTKEMECHDCILGTQQTLLNSPFDFTPEFAEDFANLTSSCGSTNYGYITPAAYALSIRTTDPPLPTPTCTNTYHVQSNDTCNSISVAYDVSTYSIVDRNDLYSDCSNLASVASICIPQQCNIYEVQRNDTCDSIIQTYGNGISGAQFLAWNPNINDLCSNLGDFRETFICLGYVPLYTPSLYASLNSRKFTRRSHWHPNTDWEQPRVTASDAVTATDKFFPRIEWILREMV